MARFEGSVERSSRFTVRGGTLRTWSLGMAMAFAWTTLWSAFVVAIEAGARPAPGQHLAAPADVRLAAAARR